MKVKIHLVTAAFLAASLVASFGQTSSINPPVKKRTASHKAQTPASPTVEEQIQALRRELQGQIDSLKSDLAAKDTLLKKAEQAAADARAAAIRAEAAAIAQQREVSDNAAAVTTLQSAVTSLRGNQATLAVTVSDETASLKNVISSPGVLRYKGIGLTPGGYLAGETVYRAHATGGDIATAFNTLPYEHADAYSLSEFYGSARQSRISLLAEGKTSWGTLRGYFEGDFLGAGVTSNNNQTNSYVFRQRALYAEAETNSRWDFSGGQMWSLANEGSKGIASTPSNTLTPLTIDPNFVPGFVWSRQYGFRVTRSFDKAAFGIAVENPQLLYTASLAGNTPYAVLGSAGNNGGFYNASISSCTPLTAIVNYANQAQTDSGGNTVNIAVPVYKTVSSCANITNISFNQAPDILAKAAFDPGYGHFEIFGILGFAHETVYPGETTNSYLYGGFTDIKTGVIVAPALTTASAYSDSIRLGGLGASFRIPVVAKKLTAGAKGLYGPGVGRYGASVLPDVTANAKGALEPIHNLSGLLTLEATPTPRLILWLNYGGDYASREDFAGSNATSLGAPTAAQNTSGVWGGTWAVPAAAAVGYGSRLLSNSACNTTTAPGYNGSSTGYYPGASCGAQTRSVQEITGGYWYDLYKGDRGRLRQGFQYGYTVREAWSGAPLTTGGAGVGAKGINNMVWTTFRYYLP
ncbi:MAG: hypothetical protein ABSB30_11530 [Terracidiphilus sp.]